MKHLFCLITTALLLASCSREAVVPQDAQPVKEAADIFPDYRDIVIPPNIAPLNVQVKSEGEEFVAALEGGGKQLVADAGKDGKLQLDSLQWKDLLNAAKGGDVSVTLYARRNGGWVSFPTYSLHVAPEPIDRYLSYRLIEPGYELYRQLGLYQRDLEGFDVATIYENNRVFEEENNHCVNCHNYQNYSTDRMLFHVRAAHGGTVFVQNGKAERLNMLSDSTAGNAVYPSWHPSRNWVVFSTNKTGQAFHVTHPDRVEVVDYGSDLLFFDAAHNTISNILKTDDTFETFPCWAPDGKKIYYCSAYVPEFKGVADSTAMDLILKVCRNVRYDVMSLTFDEQTRTFGPPVVEVACAADQKSAAVPRVSPDGKYLLFTRADFGQFHIWHKSADLWVKNLQTGDTYPLKAANSPDVDSYHTWSSNGRWIVFASRRLDGCYSRPFIAYFDRHGQAHKAFLMPQFDPEANTLLLKSYNVPELTKNRVTTTPDQLRDVIYDDAAAKKVTYRPQGK